MPKDAPTKAAISDTEVEAALADIIRNSKSAVARIEAIRELRRMRGPQAADPGVDDIGGFDELDELEPRRRSRG